MYHITMPDRGSWEYLYRKKKKLLIITMCDLAKIVIMIKGGMDITKQ